MNNHSKLYAGVLAVAAALLAVGCSGGDDGGGAANKGEWEEKYGAIVKTVSDDIDRSIQALNAGQRTVVLSECSQLREELGDAKKAVPVPDSTVDAALRAAFDATTTAVDICVEGARTAVDADKIEQAQAQMARARERYDAAQSAIEAWQ